MGVGALMGWLIAYVEVPAMLATLAMMTLLNGVNVVVTKGYTLSGLPRVPAGHRQRDGGQRAHPLLVFLVVCLALVACSQPDPDRPLPVPARLQPDRRRYSNIDVRAVLVRDYVLSSAFAALTAFVMMGQLNSVKANYAETYLLVSVLACFLGGVDPMGGGGTLSGMVLAVVILQLVSTGVNLLRVDPFFVQACGASSSWSWSPPTSSAKASRRAAACAPSGCRQQAAVHPPAGAEETVP